MDAGHTEHVHAAWHVRRGGPLEVGSLTCPPVKPEPILTERQWDDLRRAVEKD